MKNEVFKKHVLLVSACCLISVASLSHSDKEVPLTQKSLQDIRKITIIVEQKRPDFEVFHWRAKTAYGTASLLGGFEGDAIAHGIDKGKDKKEAEPMLDSVKDISCSALFAESLAPLKDSNQFEIEMKSQQEEKSLSGYDAAVNFIIKRWGLRLVEREAEKLAAFVELEAKMTRPNEKKPIWNQRHVIVGSRKETVDVFTSDQKMLRDELQATIKKAGMQMSNEILYPDAAAAEKSKNKNDDNTKNAKADSLEIDNDINFKTGPLSNIKPLKIEFDTFADNRQTQDRIGDLRNGFGGKAGVVNTARPVPEIVHDAVVQIFAKNGHTANPAEKDIVISGSVDTYWFESQLRMSSVELMGTIDITLTVRDNKGNTLYTKKYSGHHDRILGLFWPKTIIEIMDAAMENLIDQIPYDTQLIEAIKSSQK